MIVQLRQVIPSEVFKYTWIEKEIHQRSHHENRRMVLLLGKIFPCPKSSITNIHLNTRLSKYRLSSPLLFTMYIEVQTELFVFLERTYVRLSDHFGRTKTKKKVGLNSTTDELRVFNEICAQ